MYTWKRSCDRWQLLKANNKDDNQPVGNDMLLPLPWPSLLLLSLLLLLLLPLPLLLMYVDVVVPGA